MKTINQRGDALADYDARVNNWQRAGRADGFQDDAEASMPSRVLQDALGADRPLGAVGFFRGIVRAFGYCLVFLMYGVIFGIASIFAEITSPDAAHLGAAYWMGGPILTGIIGVLIQYRVNQNRRARRATRRF